MLPASSPVKAKLCNTASRNRVVLHAAPPSGHFRPSKPSQGLVRAASLETLDTDASSLFHVPPPLIVAEARHVNISTPSSGSTKAVNLLGATLCAPYKWYCDALERRPLVTKAMTSLVGFMLGDIVAQHLASGDALDTLRILRLGAYGLFIDGPVGSLWYEVLEKYICPDDPTSNQAVALKTAADQVIWAPAMTVIFFAVVKLLEGHPEGIVPTVLEKTMPTVVANYMVWPLAHVINFKYVPRDFRILYNNSVSIAWLTWLSLLMHGLPQ